MHDLFQHLFRLRSTEKRSQLEDFLTEILAHVLRNHREVLKDYLKLLGVDLGETPLSVSTQTEYPMIEGHHISSRPDMVIQGEDLTVFIENKLGSGEGWDQLKRYADHLKSSGAKTQVLGYVTQWEDVKNAEAILPKGAAISFVQLRWYQIAHMLRQHRSKPYVPELLAFMKTHKIAMNNQFSPTDILALNHFSNVRAMLDECMNAQIVNRFTALNGKPKQHASLMTQLRDHDRYMYQSFPSDDFWVGMGFRMNAFNEIPYPDAVVLIECYPSSNQRTKVIDAFREIRPGFGWESYALDDPNAWSGVFGALNFDKVLNTDNHIHAIQTFFLEKLDQLEEIYRMYPVLKHNAGSSDGL